MRIIVKHSAVVSKLVNYYRIGIDVLKEGESVVDVAIATELCVSTINAFSVAEFIDTREIAPHIANKRMFVKHPNSASIGGLSVGVLYGKLPWKRLFEPSIKLSSDRFPVSKELDIRLKIKFKQDPALSAIYAPSGKLLEKGEIIYRRNFSRILELIAENYTEFYEGYFILFFLSYYLFQ
ncbi:gamma-glutamyltranspeptidase [Gigaspora margarita]|uniref:Gamma-glutamyltranspeptidase n=1 Tax=Gigaspora margarita TaxID=4874 RepID=A0A8H3XD47_GIGMA|nr:gamma-glutamyltranspeptidase [Gigaspora margarita]